MIMATARSTRWARFRAVTTAFCVLLPTVGWAAEGDVGQAAGDVIDVTLDRAKVIRMPPHAQTIVVGNPIIADVTTLKADGLVVVTGRGFGETNMIFLDKAGAALEEATVRVVAGSSQLLVQRGLDRESYSCKPRCQPTVSLGDAESFMKGSSGQIQSRNALAAPTSH